MSNEREDMGAEGDEAPGAEGMDYGVDVSFHTPEWHAARVAALNTERMSWEEFKQRAAEKQAMAGDEDEAMRAWVLLGCSCTASYAGKYRALLDADRAKLLAKGTQNVHLKAALGDTLDKKIKKKDKKDKKRKKHKSKVSYDCVLQHEYQRTQDGKKKKKKKAKHSDSSDSSSSDDH